MLWGRKEGWNPRFVSHFKDWEMDIVQGFIDTISDKKLSPLPRIDWCGRILQVVFSQSSAALIFWKVIVSLLPL